MAAYEPGSLSLMLSGEAPSDLTEIPTAAQIVPIIRKKKEDGEKSNKRKRAEAAAKAMTENGDDKPKKKRGKRKINPDDLKDDPPVKKPKVTPAARAKLNHEDQRLPRTLFVGNLDISTKEKVCSLGVLCVAFPQLCSW